MSSHQYLRASSFRWLLVWAVLLCFGAGGTAFGQGCPGPGGPQPVAGLGAGPGSADRSFGYAAGGTGAFQMTDLLNRIGVNIPEPGEIRAIAVQRLNQPGGPAFTNANKFIVGGNFVYRVPGTNLVYRNLMRLHPNGTVDTTFPTNPLNLPPQQLTPVVNALVVHDTGPLADRIVVGCETAPRLFRLLPGGTQDPTFNPPAPITAAVLALEVEPSLLPSFGPPVPNPTADYIYVGLNGGTIGTPPRTNFTRLLPNGTPDPTGFWGLQTAPAQQVLVNGPVRAIKFADRLGGVGVPGIVVGGAFNLAQGGSSPPPPSFECLNVALFPTNGDFVSFSVGFFTAFFKGFDGPINAIAVSVSPANVSEIFVGGEFGNCVTFASPNPNVARPRVAKFSFFTGLDTGFNPNPAAAAIPNPVRALLLTGGPPNFTAPPPPLPPPPPLLLSVLHVGGQETTTAFADVALSPVTGGLVVDVDPITPGLQPTFFTRSPFFPANPAVVRAMAANNQPLPNGGALFGGAFLNATVYGQNLNAPAQKLVATFTNLYSPPSPLGPVFSPPPPPSPPFGPNPGTLPGFVALGPTQFYASALLPNGDLLIGGDVGVDGNASLPASLDDLEAVLYRIDPCGTVNVVARFRNISGYLVRNDIDNGAFVSPPADINTTQNMGFRRVDVVDPPSIRAIAVDPQGRVYVGGQFNQVSDGPGGPFVPWNNLVRLTNATAGTIDPLFQVGQDDPNPPPGYTPIRKGGPTGFGAPGVGFTTVDPQTALPALTGTCDAPPTLPTPGTGEKFNPNEGRVNAIVLQPDGRVLIGGEFKCYNEVPRSGIARLLPNGSLDPSFGDSSFSIPGVGDYELCANPGGAAVVGVARTNVAVGYNRARVNAILLEPDGRVTVAGLFARANNVDRYNIARFNIDGTLDTSFATGPTGTIFPTGTSGLGPLPATGPNNGPTSNGRRGEIFALARQSLGANAGRILVGGEFTRILNPVGANAGLARTAFTRFEPNGRHDATFAQLAFTASPIVRTIAVKADDRPLIGGPFRIGPRDIVAPDGIGYINNTTRARVHRTGVNGTFTDDTDPFGVPRATFLAVPPGVGQNPNAPLVFQPGPYAVAGAGSLASIFTAGTGTEISYYPNLPFNTTPPFGGRYTDARMTVNTITLDPARRRAYIGGLFNTVESVRADFQNDGAGTPNGLNLDIRWPGVAALQNGSGCSYGLVLPSFPPFQPIPAGTSVNLGAVNPAGGQITLATMTRSAASLCNLQPTITTTATFVTIVGAVPRPTNPGFVDIIVSLSPNDTGANRTGSITVRLPNELSPNALEDSSPESVTFTFTQGPASGCTFTSVAVPSSFPIAGGTGQFQITTGAGCTWTITGLPTWISASPLSGSGSGTVSFTVVANTGAPRSATVTVAGQNITITQAGTCTLTLGTATGTSLPVTGGTGSFTVTTSSGCTYTATSSAPWLVITGGASGGPTGTVTFSVGRNSGAARQATITVTTQGAPSQSVTVSQAPDSGPDTVGMFRPSNGFFYLRFSNTSGNADIDFFYGTANDVPLSGDWNADGITTIGVFRNGQFFLRNSNTAGFADVPAFAIDGTQPGDIPLAGDWDGNGSTTVGLFRAGVFLLRNSNTSGPADIIINYALPTDTPIVGDWDGDGVTTIGLYRASVAFFGLRNSNTAGPAELQFFFGAPGDTPVAGDWNGNGITTIGVFRAGTFFLRNSNSAGTADLTVNYGVPTDRPVIGKWR